MKTLTEIAEDVPFVENSNIHIPMFVFREPGGAPRSISATPVPGVPGGGSLNPGSVACPFLANGRCHRGDQCAFMHFLPADSLTTSPLSSEVTPSATPLPPHLDKCRGQVVQLAQEQLGCRYLQQLLDTDPHATAALLVKEVDCWPDLMCNQFANYVCQRFLQIATQEQRVAVLDACCPFLFEISVHPHGTRSVQALCDRCDSQNEAQMLVEALARVAPELVLDPNGTHVVQRLLGVLGETSDEMTEGFADLLAPLLEVITEHAHSIAVAKHGCCVLQRAADVFTGQSRDRLVSVISRLSPELSQNMYGNFVVQHVFRVCSDSQKVDIITSLLPTLNQLCCQKHGSNVVETCLAAPAPLAQPILETLLSYGDGELVAIAGDQYGNYVVQKIVQLPWEDSRLVDEIVAILRRNEQKLHSSHGKRVIQKLRY